MDAKRAVSTASLRRHYPDQVQRVSLSPQALTVSLLSSDCRGTPNWLARDYLTYPLKLKNRQTGQPKPLPVQLKIRTLGGLKNQ